MSEWKTYKLGEIAERITSGGTPSTRKSEYYGGTIPWVRTQEINFNRIYDTEIKITDEAIRNSSAKMIDVNSIIVAMYGATAGRIAINKIPLTTNQACCNITIDAKKADYNFVYYFLKSKFNEILNMATGAAQQNLNAGMLRNFEILAPDLSTQRQIAQILSSLDDKIELNLQMNQTLEAIAQAIFKEWFVNFNFPSSEHDLKDYKMDKILEDYSKSKNLGNQFNPKNPVQDNGLPKGWRMGKVKDVYNTTSGGTPSRTKPEFYENGTINWVKSKELNGSFIFETEEKITEDAVKKSSAKLIPRHSILLAMYGATVGEYAITTKETTCNQAICAVIENGAFPFTYFFEYFKMNKNGIIGRASGSAQQNISQALIQQLEILIPSDEVVKAYHSVVESLFVKIENNMFDNQLFTQTRDTLLPKLMSGKIRLNTI